jgi:GWxTD domain-containing protein
MRRLALPLAAAAAVAGCGTWKRVGSTDQPRPAESLTEIFNTQAYYQKLGRLAAGDPLPFVGTVAFTASTGDTVLATVGLSLSNRNLSFQKEGQGFAAHYRVDVSFQRGAEPPVAGGQDEVVRVATFAETQRADETILFQKAFRLLPGSYKVVVTMRDPNSTGSSRAEATFDAPHFTPGSTTRPILVYQATGRGELSDPLRIVLNPRGAVAYRSDTLLAYVEGYRFAGPTKVPFEVRTQDDSVVFRDSLQFHGDRPVESQVIRMRPDSISLGEFAVVVGQGAERKSTSALVSFSSAWVVTNFDEMLSLLRYFGDDAKLAELRKAAPSERGRLWKEFWTETDPDPTTPENEAINQYLTRVTIANQRYKEEGIAGWRTDRGEAFIRLGDPDETYDTSPGTANRVLRWTYVNYRIELYFVDETGFGRFRLTPASRAALEETAARLGRLGK